MSGRTRFCVLFASSEDGQPAKTRLLHNDSSREELIEIWKEMYNEEDVPIDAELINEDCVYRLDDDNDIAAFLAQAEDQYRLLPSQPLRVLFVASQRYCRSNNTSPTANNDSISLPSTKSPAQPEVVIKRENGIGKDLSQENCNNNNGHIEDIRPSPACGESSSCDKEFPEDTNLEQTPAWAPANSLLMLYNRYRGQEKNTENQSYSGADSRTVGGAIDKITTASASNHSAKVLDDRKRYNGTTEQQVYSNPYAAYTKQLADSLGRPPAPFAADPNKDKGAENSFCGVPPNGGVPNPMFNLSAYSAFINGLQERKQMAHANPNASYILQTLFNNHIKGNLSMPTPQRPGYSKLETSSPTRTSLVPQSGLMTSPPEYSVPTSAFQSGRPPSLLSTLAQYNNSSLLSYINGTAMTNIQNGMSSNHHSNDLPKKVQRRRKRNGMVLEDDRGTDPSKRMRSSVSQSNIEYHYQRALDYSQMPEEDQKLQNSAHRSHWKHLLFVAKISPKFLEQFKHAKYDEWSSEARDIYAMCQPDKYMWSFLTLSKQGDMLCKRIIGRIDDLLRKSKEDRPDWCPGDEMLLRAQTRAKERLSQLQRILYSRSVNQEAKAAEKANELDKISMQGKNLALMTAYHQSQQELLRSQQSFVKDAVAFRHHPQQENLRPPVGYPTNQTTHCSSVTSSPLSVASPAFEDNHSAGSACADSPAILSHEERRTEGNLIIVEEREASSSPEPIGNLSDHISPLPYVTNGASPQKWAAKVEGIADA